MKKKLFLGALILGLTGCATSQFNAESRPDGKYILGNKVEVSGTLKDIIVYNKDGEVISSISQAVSDISSDSSFLSAASQLGGVSSLEGGLIGGVVGTLAEVVSASSRPVVRAFVYDSEKDDTAVIPINTNSLKHLLEINCLMVGDSVNVYRGAGQYQIVQEKTEWMRRNDFDKSCEELRLVNR